MRLLALTTALLACLHGCSCDPPPDPPPSARPGSVSVVVDGGTATVSVAGLPRALRAFQVDVDVSGGQASAVTASGGHDLVEAGLAPEDGGAKNLFTLVVADTRRLPINNGAVARLTVDSGAEVTLRNPSAIDEQGNRQEMIVGTQP
jgi:hypothetical protein